MKIYLAGKMSDEPHFNASAFDYAALRLRFQGFVVFSPVEHDREVYGYDIHDNPTGDVKLAEINNGFSRRRVLGDDLSWICKHADAIAILPGWENSSGVKAELATAEALGLTVIKLGKEFVE